MNCVKQFFPAYCGRIALLLLVAFPLGCGGGSVGSVPSTPITPSPPTAASVPQFEHVFLLIEENHSYSDVVGNPGMPYLNSLIRTNALATQYYADLHPSLPNYFMLTTGQPIAISDTYTQPVTDDNIVRALTNAKKTWKCYAESLPAVGYLGADIGAYMQHHNPCVYFSDVQTSAAQAGNVVPFTDFAGDLANQSLPSYALIIPNITDDGHSCADLTMNCADSQKLAQADLWLQTNIDPLIKSAVFQNSLLIITFDESEITDLTYGGGHVATVLVSPKIKPGYQSTTLYQHQSTLRLTMEAAGVPDLPGTAAIAPDMVEFFQ